VASGILVSKTAARRRYDDVPAPSLELLYYGAVLVQWGMPIWYLFVSRWYLAVALLGVGWIVGILLAYFVQRTVEGGGLLRRKNLFLEAETARNGTFGCLFLAAVMALLIVTVHLGVLRVEATMSFADPFRPKWQHSDPIARGVVPSRRRCRRGATSSRRPGGSRRGGPIHSSRCHRARVEVMAVRESAPVGAGVAGHQR